MKCATGIALLMIALPASGQVPLCEAPTRRDSGRICATLAVENGRFAVAGNPVIVRGGLPATVTEAHVLESLEVALREAGMPYQAGMPPEDLEADARYADPARVALRTTTSSWEDYVGAAAATGIDTEVMLNAVSGVLGALRQKAGFVTVEDANELFDTETGATQLDAVALTETADILIASIAGEDERKAALQSYLKPLFGTLWERPAVIARVDEYYAYLGLTPESDADPREGRIEVIEGTRVREVTLPPLGQGEDEADARARMKALYAVLDDSDFRRWLKNKPADNAVGYVRDLGRKEGSEPYFFPTRAQVQQLLLAQSDLAMQLLEAETRSMAGFKLQQKYLGLRVVRPNPRAVEAPRPAAPGTDDLGLVNPNGTPGDRAADRGPDAVDRLAKPDRERKNYVGVGVGYQPGQGVTVLGLYQRNRLAFPLRDSSFGARVARTGDNLISPSVNYFADYVMFERLHRRVSVQLNGSSEVTSNRFLNGVYQDVRRTGGLGRLEIEAFRDRDGRRLRLQFEGGRAAVYRAFPEGAEIVQDLTTADAGLSFVRERLQSLHPWRVSFQPVLRWGPGFGEEPAFTRFRATGDAHIQVSRGFELDFACSLQKASANTPVFELPSLGGTESVRGFRSDDAIGQLLWSAQTELWTPVPFRVKPGDERGDFLRRVVRLALFADLGGVSQPAMGSTAGIRGGLGVGLRLNFNPVTLRLDFAYGIGSAATDGSRGKFYLSVKTNLPF